MRGPWNRETRRGLSLVFLPWSQDSPALPQHYLMFHEYESALMLLQRWTAPTRHVRHPEKEQYHRKGQFFLTVQSAACSELLAAREKDKPEKNASSCDPDKDATERQVAGSQRSAAFARVYGEPRTSAVRIFGAVHGQEKAAGVASRRSLIHSAKLIVRFADRRPVGLRRLVRVRHLVGRRPVSRALSLCHDRPVGRLAVPEA